MRIVFGLLALTTACGGAPIVVPGEGVVPAVDPLVGSAVPGRLLVHAPTECVTALTGQISADWAADPMFGTSTDDGSTTATSEGSVPSVLQQFCVVTRPCDVEGRCDPSVAPLDPAAFQNLVGDGYSVGLDYRALNSTAGFVDAAAPWLSQRVDQEMRVATPPTGSGTVELVVVDTQPDGPFTDATPSGTSAHGFVLANLALHLVCPGGTCGPVSVRTRLALNLVNKNGNDADMEIDNGSGGSFGTFMGLAQAIRAETRRWVASGATSRLILNLSVGWNPIFGGAAPATEPSTHAVYLALRDAQCRGVLIFAAAGNATGGPDSLGALSGRTGPYYPAAWQGSTPGEGCATFTAGSRDGADDLSSDPLLYAVGGVDEDGWDLGISRPNARPQLLAFADHVVLMKAGAPLAAPMTGTSVGTVVVSSAAAVRWVNSPTDTPAGIVKALYGAATATKDPVVGTSPRPVQGPFAGSMGTSQNDAKIVDMCTAGTGCATALKAPDPVFSGVTFKPASTGSPYPSGSEPPMSQCMVDGAATVLNGVPNTGLTQDLLCPYLHYYSPEVRPFVGPQPDPWGCPLCVLDRSNGEFRGNIEGTNHANYSNHVVTVSRINPGGAPHAFNVTLPTTGDFTVNLGCTSAGSPTAATLTSSGPGGSGVGSVLLVGTNNACP